MAVHACTPRGRRARVQSHTILKEYILAYNKHNFSTAQQRKQHTSPSSVEQINYSKKSHTMKYYQEIISIGEYNNMAEFQMKCVKFKP